MKFGSLYINFEGMLFTRECKDLFHYRTEVSKCIIFKYVGFISNTKVDNDRKPHSTC